MDSLSFISLGGVGDVTKNMSVYQFGNEILLVDCGIGFVDESMPGVDLVIPNVSYLKGTNPSTSSGQAKKIVGMILTHGHEDHIGAFPFILPLLPSFPIYASTLTAALANEKLAEFGEKNTVQTVRFDDTVKLGSFSVCFMGRSCVKSRDVGRKLKYLDLPMKSEIRPQDVRRVPPNQVLLLVAGSQAQIESALVRIAEGQDKDIRI